jgi:hypothetical protein
MFGWVSARRLPGCAPTLPHPQTWTTVTWPPLPRDDWRGSHVRVPLGAFLSVVPAVDSPPTSVAVDCSSVPPHSLLRFLAARFLLPDPPLASRFMAMWRAAARQLVDRALGSRAAHVIQSSLPYLSRRLRFDPMVTLFLL